MNYIKVAYPFGGKHYIANWHEHSEGNHVVIAHSKMAVESTLKSIIEFHGTSTMVKYFAEVDIVCAPEYYHKIAYDLVREDEIEQFAREVTTMLLSLANDGFEIPIGKVCSKFEFISNNSSYDYEYHYDCKNCTDKIILPCSKEELYNKYYDTFTILNKERNKHNKSIMHPESSYKETMWLSKAPVCDDATDLKYITTNFGHHSTGLNFKDSFKDSANASNVKRILFFYKEIQQFDCSQFVKITNKMKEDKKQATALWANSNEERRVKENQDNLNFLNKVFLA